MITLFHVSGAYIYVDPDGHAVGVKDVFTKLAAARAHYSARPAWELIMPTASYAEPAMPAMRIAVGIGGWASGADRDWPQVVRFAVESERIGADSCWSAEAWGQDAIAPLAYLAARTERITLGTGGHADQRAGPVDDRDDRDDDGRHLRRPFRTRARGERAAGRGGPAWRAVRPAAGPPDRVPRRPGPRLRRAAAGIPRLALLAPPARRRRQGPAPGPGPGRRRSRSTWPPSGRGAWNWPAPEPTGGWAAVSSRRRLPPTWTRSGAEPARPAAIWPTLTCTAGGR